MKLTLYHLKTCDTCRKAIKALQTAGHDLSLIDVRADGMARPVLEGLIEAHGWEIVVNRRSTTWRGLEAADKENINNQSAIALIGAHPTLMKRPVIMSADKTTIGWSKTEQAAWL